MATSAAARSRATAKYTKEHQRRFTFSCHNEYDADIIGYLEGMDNFSGYIKDLLRAEAKKAKKS